ERRCQFSIHAQHGRRTGSGHPRCAAPYPGRSDARGCRGGTCTCIGRILSFSRALQIAGRFCFCLRQLEWQRQETIFLIKINFKKSEEHTSELQSRENLVCRLLLEKKNEARRRM